MLLYALGFETAALRARCRRADLVLRCEADARRIEAAMIDARVDIERGKALVDMDTPALAPLLDLRRRVPRADLRTEPGFATFADDDLAHRQHDMGVGFGLPVGADIPMDIAVGDHAGIRSEERLVGTECDSP